MRPSYGREQSQSDGALQAYNAHALTRACIPPTPPQPSLSHTHTHTNIHTYTHTHAHTHTMSMMLANSVTDIYPVAMLVTDSRKVLLLSPCFLSLPYVPIVYRTRTCIHTTSSSCLQVAVRTLNLHDDQGRMSSHKLIRTFACLQLRKPPTVICTTQMAAHTHTTRHQHYLTSYQGH